MILVKEEHLGQTEFRLFLNKEAEPPYFILDRLCFGLADTIAFPYEPDAVIEWAGDGGVWTNHPEKGETIILHPLKTYVDGKIALH